MQTGIQHRISCPYTSPQNRTIERRHRQIVEVGLSLLSHSNVPSSHWDSAFQMATYFINRLSCTSINSFSPFEKLLHIPPDYSLLKTFGCVCWPYLRPFNKHKMNFGSELCIFLGYSPFHRGFKCLDLQSNRVFISRHILFDDRIFRFSNSNPNTSNSNHSKPTWTSPTLSSWTYLPTNLSITNQ